MEQVQSNVQTAQSSWFGQAKVSVARQLVLAKLQKITDACIEIHEEGSVQLLGCPQASLWGVIDVHDSSMYLDFVKGGSIGAAEAYIAGKWSSPDLTALIQVFARCQAQLDSLEQQKTWLAKYKHQWFHRSKKNSKGQARDNILAHYDLGNQLYTRFLDKQMMYSSAIYSEGADNLDDAQLHKLDTICRRLELKPGEHLIEIGTGWGGLAIHAASQYGCRVTTTTISDAQYEYAKARIAELNLCDKITLLKKDYRDLTGQYDKLVSIEMIEAVGHEYFDTFFNQCNALVKSGGKMLLQAITIADQRFEHYKNNVDFIQRYIFPGGCLPSIGVLSRHIGKDTDMVIEQLHDIGLHYARTLKDWRERFEANWHQLKALGYDERFKRMWLYYLQYCEGAFLERVTSTVHLVARK